MAAEGVVCCRESRPYQDLKRTDICPYNPAKVWPVSSSARSSALARTISEDTKLPLREAELLARGLAGMAQVSALYWLETKGNLDMNTASDLIYRLAWRGISRFPKET